LLQALDTVWQTCTICSAEETQRGKQYGGVMIWELTGDAPAPLHT
jgi:hypothetical protein